MCVACGGGTSGCFWDATAITTYADLQDFEECTKIIGPLHLSQCTDCTDLLPLSNVEKIVLLSPTATKSIRIDNNDALVSLNGLERLLQGEFEGDITIRKNRQLESLSSFSGLRIIRGDLLLEENTKLIKLNGLENIHTITGHLTVVGNARLFTIESFRSLEDLSLIHI